MMRRLALLVTMLSATLAQAAEIKATITDATGKPVSDAVFFLTGANMPSAAAGSVDIDQVDKEFVPRISVVRVGTSVYFPNSDNIRHQVYSFSPAKTFTLKLYSGRPSAPVVFDKPGVAVLGCNIHDHMVGWVLALDTPWYARADAQGHAKVNALPAGKYQLSVWRPGLNQPKSSGEVELHEGADIDRAITLDESTPLATHQDHQDPSRS